MIINLISSPRNISTALMYSFAQRADTKVMDEPFYAYYLSLTDADHPGKEEILTSQPTSFGGVKDWIEHTASQHEVVFIKNMAHHLINMDLHFLEDFVNVFLIRNPAELITSFAKVIPYPTMNDIGLKRQKEIFEFASQFDICPVIDSNDVVSNPSKALGILCEKLNIKFDNKMLSWNMGAIEEDGIWAKHWYKAVHNSTGFQSPDTENRQVPVHLADLLAACTPIYNDLKSKSIL